jgi:hypothetical protein
MMLEITGTFGTGGAWKMNNPRRKLAEVPSPGIATVSLAHSIVNTVGTAKECTQIPNKLHS